jgi:hypothetical protein
MMKFIEEDFDTKEAMAEPEADDLSAKCKELVDAAREYLAATGGEPDPRNPAPYARMEAAIAVGTTALAIIRGKAEIEEDIETGVVVETNVTGITRFADLHDHVDANEYGGLTEDAFSAAFPAPGDFIEAANAVQNALDEWIRAGRPAD